MRIGIDIDETISKTHEKVYEEARKYSLNKFNRKYENPNEWTLINRFNWSREEADEFFKENLESILLNLDVIEGASEIINKLYYEGHEIVFITARNYDYKDPLEVSKKWLEEKGFKYNDIFVDIIDKWKICELENINLFIDDNLENCINTSNKNTETIWFRGNREIEGLETFDSWTSIYKYIHNSD